MIYSVRVHGVADSGVIDSSGELTQWPRKTGLIRKRPSSLTIALLCKAARDGLRAKLLLEIGIKIARKKLLLKTPYFSAESISCSDLF